MTPYLIQLLALMLVSSLSLPTLSRAGDPIVIPGVCEIRLSSASHADFTKNDLETIRQLSELNEYELASAAAKLDPEQLYYLARRAMILDLGLQRPLEDKPSPSSFPQTGWIELELLDGQAYSDVKAMFPGWFQLSAFVQRLTRHFVERVPLKEKRRLAARNPFLPADRLVDPRWSISGSGLLKSALFQAVDQWVDASIGLNPMEVHIAMAKMPIPEEFRTEETYWALNPAMLHTSYIDIQSAMSFVRPVAGQKIVDLGSGVGRVGFLLAMKYPGVQFTGYELVPERIQEARRVAQAMGWHHLKFVEQNLSDPAFIPDEADYYFMYDPVSDDTREKLLRDLEKISQRRTFHLIAIEGRGRFIESLQKVKWLEHVTRKHYDVTPENRISMYWKYQVFRSKRSETAEVTH